MNKDEIIKTIVKVVEEELGTEEINMSDPQARNVVIGTGFFGLLLAMNPCLSDLPIEEELRWVARRIKEQFSRT